MLVKSYLQNKQTKNKSDLVVHVCYPSYSGGRSRRILVQGQPGKKPETQLKNKLKQKYNVGQETQHLPNKHEALSSNPSIAKQQKYF
jgi:hypothetical protein